MRWIRRLGSSAALLMLCAPAADARGPGSLDPAFGVKLVPNLQATLQPPAQRPRGVVAGLSDGRVAVAEGRVVAFVGPDGVTSQLVSAGFPVQELAATPDGGFVAVGTSVARFGGDGAVRWTQPLDAPAFGIAVSADGDVVVGGGTDAPFVTRLDGATGAPDAGFGDAGTVRPAGAGRVESVIGLTDGTMVAGGAFGTVGLRADGSAAFPPAGASSVLAQRGDGFLARVADGVVAFGPDGARVPGYLPYDGCCAAPFALLPLADGRVLAPRIEEPGAQLGILGPGGGLQAAVDTVALREAGIEPTGLARLPDGGVLVAGVRGPQVVVARLLTDPQVARVTVARRVRVRGDRAYLRLRCTGAAGCAGVAQLGRFAQEVDYVVPGGQRRTVSVPYRRGAVRRNVYLDNVPEVPRVRPVRVVRRPG